MADMVTTEIQMKGIGTLPLYSLVEKEDHGFEAEFDFNKLIPMPEELNLPADNLEAKAILCYLSDRAAKPASCNMFAFVCQAAKGTYQVREPECFRIYQSLKGETTNNLKELYQRGRRYVRNYQKYGSTEWYDWRKRHWNTTECVKSTYIMGNDAICIKTVSNAPFPVIEELSRRYSDEPVRTTSFSKDREYLGSYLFTNGKKEKINGSQ